MYNGLMHAHSGLRWIVLLLLIFSIIRAFMGSKENVLKDRKLFSITMASVHLQILIGIGLYIISPLMKGFMEQEGMMKIPVARFFVVEHLVMMILAGLFVTIGNSRFKKKPELDSKYKAIKIFFVLALVVIFFAIPWPFREIGVGRGWF